MGKVKPDKQKDRIKILTGKEERHLKEQRSEKCKTDCCL